MKKFTKNKIVAVRLSGGLGNQMFQLFAGYVAAKESNVKYLYLDCSALKSYNSKRSLEINFFLKFLDGVEVIYEIPLIINMFFKLRICKILDVSFFNFCFISTPNKFKRINFKKTSAILLDGYFQDPDLFKGRITTDQLNSNFIDGYSNVLNKYKKNNFQLVGVHIRRGDYLKSKESKIYNIINFDYYDKAFALLNFDGSRERVLIFSDDIEVGLTAAKRYSATYVNSCEIRLDEEFALLSMCDKIIGTNSTFSWWAAYLLMSPHKTICFPMNWYVDQFKNNENKLLLNEFIKI